MFSEAIARLRAEAEKTTKTNGELLAEWKDKGMFQNVSDIESGQSSKTLGNVIGGGLNATGVLGIMGVASANLAAATGGSALLAGVSTALAGLGTVVVGATVLPVVSVVAIGVGAVGASVLLMNQLRSVDHQKGYDRALVQENNLVTNAVIDEHGHDGKIGLKNWLQGAKNLVSKSIRELLEMNPKIANQYDSNGTSLLGMADRANVQIIKAPDLEQAKLALSEMTNRDDKLEYVMTLPDSVKEGLKPWLREQKDAREAKAALDAQQAQDALNVVVDPYDDIVDKATNSLETKGVMGVVRDANKESGSYIGNVVDKNEKFALIDIGRNHLVVVPSTISNGVLEVGKRVSLKFNNGIAQDVSQAQSRVREQGLER